MGGWVGGWARWVRGLVVGKGGCRQLGGSWGWGGGQHKIQNSPRTAYVLVSVYAMASVEALK